MKKYLGGLPPRKGASDAARRAAASHQSVPQSEPRKRKLDERRNVGGSASEYDDAGDNFCIFGEDDEPLANHSEGGENAADEGLGGVGELQNDSTAIDMLVLGQRLQEIAHGDETELPADIDFVALQEEQQYDAIQDMTVPIDDLPVGTFDDDNAVLETSTDTDTPADTAAPASASSMLPPARPKVDVTPTLQDKSEQIEQERLDEILSPFELGIGLWFMQIGASRKQYKDFKDVVSTAESLEQIQKLPARLETIKRYVNAQVPQLKMAKRAIPLRPEKLPTAAESRKRDEEGNLVEDLVFFDVEDVVKRFMSSPVIREKQHIGFGEFQDTPTEFYHSHSWLSSVRTTSGQYARYPDNKPLFPSDILTFRCQDTKCSKIHFGRVFEVGRDFRTGASNSGDVVLEIHELLPATYTAFKTACLKAVLDKVVFVDREYLLTTTVYTVSSSAVLARHNSFVFDYHYGDNKLDSANPLSMVAGRNTVRRVINMSSNPPKTWLLARESPLRAELELAHYGRQHFEDNFDVGGPGQRPQACISVPLMVFIDGFGLYRNSYRSLMGIYMMFAGLQATERDRAANVLPITLGPHGSNFDDVIKSLLKLQSLDKGVTSVQIRGVETTLCAFTMVFIGDMPQQQANAGFKSQRAKLSCRFCFIGEDDRHDLDFDLKDYGRYHHQAIAMRTHMNGLRTIKARAAYATKHGISDNPSPLNLITPALDRIISTPSDPAHSEYNGLTRLLHCLLIEQLLTPPNVRKYTKRLRVFPFPPGYARLMSPFHHLRSYSLSDHARWSIIIPVLMRLWLRRKYLKDHLQSLELVEDPVATIVKCLAAVARSNQVLSSRDVPQGLLHDIDKVVKDARRQYQDLLEMVATALEAVPASRPTSRAGSRRGSQSGEGHAPSGVVSGDTAMPDDDPDDEVSEGAPKISNKKDNMKERAAKAVSLRRDKNRPNIHTALHYARIQKEYGLPSNCDTLIFENMHRFFKKKVLQTNHYRVEGTMLQMQNLEHSCRLVLMGAWDEEEPAATALIRAVNKSCPDLFNSMLPRSEQDFLRDADDDQVDIVSDAQHHKPAAIGPLTAEYCKTVLHVPTRAGKKLPIDFIRNLSQAFGNDYGQPGILEFGNKAIHWCKKLAFTDSGTRDRVTFADGDFVALQDHSVVRLAGLMTITLLGQRFLFANVERLAVSANRDPLLDVTILTPANCGAKFDLVGLPAILSQRLYVVPFKRTAGEIESESLSIVGADETADGFLWMDWSVHWL